MAQKPPAKDSTKPGFFKSITGALDDVINEIKADVQAMTPPEPKEDPRAVKERDAEAARIADLLSQNTSGVVEESVDVAIVDDEPLEFEEENGRAPTAAKTPQGLPAGNLWNNLTDSTVSARLRTDACYHAHTVADVKQYYTALAEEGAPPYTLGILAVNFLALTEEEAQDPGVQDLLTKAALTTIAGEMRIYGAVGAGPRNLWPELSTLDDHLTTLLNENPKIIAIGPVGIDEQFAPYTVAQQQDQLALQLEIAKDFGLPVLLSNRKSHAAIAQTLKGKGRENLPPLVYLDPLTEDADVELVREFGMYALLRPELTTPGLPVAPNYRAIPITSLLLGSGSALVAPHGYSGHFNQPKFLQNTLEAVAKMLSMRPEALLTQTNRNLAELFHK